MEQQAAEKAALVIVDVQNDFCTGGSLCVPENEQIFEIINKLREDARFSHVFLTRDWHPTNHCSFHENNPGSELFKPITLPDTGMEQVMWPTHCVQDSQGAQFHKDLIRKESDIVVNKGMLDRVDSYSGFGSHPEKTTLESLLREREINTIYCVGLAYDYCVGSTAVDGAKLGFKTYLLTDATRSVAQPSHEAMDKRLQEAGVIQVKSD